MRNISRALSAVVRACSAVRRNSSRRGALLQGRHGHAQRPSALIEFQFALIGGAFPLVGHDFALIGGAFPLVGHDLALIGLALPLVGHDLALIGARSRAATVSC